MNRVGSVDAGRHSDPYARVIGLITAEECVIMDGAVGTELFDVAGQPPDVEEHLWGVTAILDAPARVADVHRRYVEVGCDLVSTNTWGLPTALREGSLWESAGSVHWMDVARDAVRLARSAAADAGS